MSSKGATEEPQDYILKLTLVILELIIKSKKKKILVVLNNSFWSSFVGGVINFKKEHF